ncbi:MAG TPA: hypothetical protein VJ960_04015 [Oceanipulchritudo sp.]|nr:hypothetical protein [Oceanipulchritudo sp.]
MKSSIHKPVFLRPLRAIACCSLMAAAPVSAETIAYEGFDIPPGEIDNTAGETSFGWKADNFGGETTWWAWDQSNNDFYHGVSEEGLVYEDLPVIGNAFEFRDEAIDVSRFVYRQLPKFYNYYSSGQLWLSALFQAQIDGDPDGGGYFQLTLSDAQNDVYMGVANSRDFSVWSAGGERLMVDGVRGEKWGLSDVPIEVGETVFLVLHLDFDNKTGAFYANPPVDAEDPGEPAAEFTMWTDLFVDKVMLWIYNAGPSAGEEALGADYTGSLIDEIRLGDTYASVAAAADLTDPGGGEVDETPPVITGPSGEPGDATAVASVPEDTVRVGTLTTDETASWAISGGDDGDLFTIGAGTGGLSFKVFADFENPTDADGDGDYVVEVSATDAAGNTSTQTITVTVTDVEPEAWTHYMPDLNGWINTNADEASFIGWINVEDQPWIWSDPLGKALYIADDWVDDTGAWIYVPYYGEIANSGSAWALWADESGAWVDTDSDEHAYLGWLNFYTKPWLYSLNWENYLYIDESQVTESGTWIYALIELPPEEEEQPSE